MKDKSAYIKMTLAAVTILGLLLLFFLLSPIPILNLG